MNYERLKLLRKHIAKSRRFDYAVWCAVRDWRKEDQDSFNPPPAETLNKKGCGTVGCVSGHTVALFGGPRQQKDLEIWNVARRLLRLNEDDSSFLFYGGKGYGMDRVDSITAATKKDALKRLDVLIATEKVK